MGAVGINNERAALKFVFRRLGGGKIGLCGLFCACIVEPYLDIVTLYVDYYVVGDRLKLQLGVLGKHVCYL